MNFTSKYEFDEFIISIKNMGLTPTHELRLLHYAYKAWEQNRMAIMYDDHLPSLYPPKLPELLSDTAITSLPKGML